MTNKILRFLFGWCYDFDTPNNEITEMTDEEAKYVDEHFNDMPIWRKQSR